MMALLDADDVLEAGRESVRSLAFWCTAVRVFGRDRTRFSLLLQFVVQ